jgi:pyrroloquinoline quinone (PQQ) biosynthesis protein C
MFNDTFLEELQYDAQSHPVLRHPFLRRFAEGKLTREQAQAFSAQHYLYSRRFAQNLAALISNTPDENARMLLVLNMYEEIGEPSRIRDRVHFLLLERGLVSGTELAHAMEEQVESGHGDDVVSLLIKRGVVTRGQVSSLMELNTKQARDLTHPALFRRFLRALGLTPEVLAEVQMLPETAAFNATYEQICRNSNWLEGMGAMGPGTECVVPAIYSQILAGLSQGGLVSEADRVFWTIHVHCDDGHGRNIVEAMRQHLTDEPQRQLVKRGALRVLDARSEWLTGLYRHVFKQEPPAQLLSKRPSRTTLDPVAAPVVMIEAQPAAREPVSKEHAAREFSKRGDAVFQALATRFPSAKRWRLLIEQRLPETRFQAIHAAMLRYVSRVLESPFTLNEADALKLLLQERGKIANYSSGAMLAPKREHTLEFNALHAAVAAAFADFGIDGHVDGIDLPINVRMVYGEADSARTAAPFASSKRHADVWAGVPPDAVVVVLPVLGDIDNITIECAEMPREHELSAMTAMRDYDEGADIPVVRKYDECQMKHGHVYLADVRLLHQTVRRAPNGVRLSVDFRFRTNDLSYRAMVPPLQSNGPDAVDTRVPYGDWLALGERQLIVFDESMSDARAGKTQVSSAPVNLAKYRVLPRSAFEE